MQLNFSGHYDRDPGLDQYILALTDDQLEQINEWTCTSSHVNGQQRGGQHQVGGLIPPVHHVKNLDKYEVTTIWEHAEVKSALTLVILVPEDSRHVKGVEGE